MARQARKNQAILTHQGRRFLIYQDENSYWRFSLDEVGDTSTGTKELQQALNMVYEAIGERRNGGPRG